jgi:hypothetical protein
MTPPILTVLEPLKAPATILLDSTCATYLPPALCATCGKAGLSEPLRPRGFTAEEFKIAAAQLQELTWELKTLHRSSTRCPLCRMLLECLKEFGEYDASLEADVCVSLEHIGEYQDMGEYTLWMMFTRQRPKPMTTEFNRCQLRVGLRLKAGEETLTRKTTNESLPCSDSSEFTLFDHSNNGLDAVSQLQSPVSHPKDHPPRDRNRTVFVASNESQSLSYSSCEREMSHVPGRLAISDRLEPLFENMRALLESFCDPSLEPEGKEPSVVSSIKVSRPIQSLSVRPGQILDSPRSHTVKFSSLGIRRLGRQPTGPIDRQYGSFVSGTRLTTFFQATPGALKSKTS